MFFKKFLSKKEKKLEIEISPKMEFDFTMDYVRFSLEMEKTLEDKVNMLDFFMEIIRKDIQYDLMSKFLYSEMDDIFIDAPIPISLMSKDPNEEDKAILVREDKIVDLSKDSIGLNWYLNGEKYTIEVFDFRIAILYELAKNKYNLTKNSL